MPTFKELSGKPYAPCCRARIVAFVLIHPGHSATEIAHKLNMETRRVSSELAKLEKMCDIKRIAGDGPCGGYTYHPRVL